MSHCHGPIEQVHYGGQPLQCIDCHGGDPAARSMVEGHETVLYSFNPSSSALANWWTRSRQQGVIVGPVLEALDEVDPSVIQFLNPADGRAVAETCGSTSLAGGDCHADIAQKTSEGTYKPGWQYFDADSGALGLYGFVEGQTPQPGFNDLPAEDQQLIKDTVKAALEGKFTRFDVFKGPISDNKGNVILADGVSLEQADLDGFKEFGSPCNTCMYWWAEGITAELPSLGG